MSKWVIYLGLAVLGTLLFVLCILTFNSEDFYLWGGLLLVYLGGICFYWGLKKEKTSIYGLRFRLVAGGAISIITGIILLIS
jgi:hypothetical protein